MVYISYNKLWESQSDVIVTKRDKLRDLETNQFNLEVHDTYRKYEKISTNFETIQNEYVINKTYLDENLIKIQGQISYFEKDYNEFKLQNNKESVEVLIQRALKTTIQILYDKGLFDSYSNTDKILQNFFYYKT